MDTTPSKKSQSFCSPIFLADAFFRLLLKKNFFLFSTKSFIFFFQVNFSFIPSISILYMKKVYCIWRKYTCLESQCLWSRSPSFLPVRQYMLLGDNADPLTYSRHRREQNSSPVCLHTTPLVWSECPWWGPKQMEDHAVWYFQPYQPMKHIKNTCYLISVKLYICIHNITCNS